LPSASLSVIPNPERSGLLLGVESFMRGVFFNHPLEYRLETSSEDLYQGDTVRGTVIVKNHGTEPIDIADLCVKLSLGDLKKVKAKASDAFEDILTASIEPALLVNPQESAARDWVIDTDRNCPVVDRAQSPYLQYGDASSQESLGQLPLSVKPHKYVQAVLDTMETVFNFTSKGLSSKDGRVVAKLKAPDARRLSLVEELNLAFRFEGDDLQVGYLFKVKRFDTSAVTKVDVKKGKVEVDQSWRLDDYTFGGGFIQQEFVERSISEALEAVATGF
jgi:hypothetical protein